MADIRETGEVEVALAGRPFRIRKEFLDDIGEQNLADCVAKLRKALLVLHSPTDDLVGIENASAIFTTAKHPKSFVSLAGADHLLSRRADAVYVAEVIAAWSERYLDMVPQPDQIPIEGVLVAETRNSKFQQSVIAGPHRYLADEPTSAGGNGSGPNPYEYLLASLGACTSMTIRMYADLKKIPLERVSVRAPARQDPRGGLRELRDQGREDRPHRSRGDPRGRSLGRATQKADGDRRQVSGAPHAHLRDRASGPRSGAAGMSIVIVGAPGRQPRNWC